MFHHYLFHLRSCAASVSGKSSGGIRNTSRGNNVMFWDKTGGMILPFVVALIDLVAIIYPEIASAAAGLVATAGLVAKIVGFHTHIHLCRGLSVGWLFCTSRFLGCPWTSAVLVCMSYYWVSLYQPDILSFPTDDGSAKKHESRYAVLGLTSDATPEQIKTAYMQAALEYHPKGRHMSRKDEKELTRLFQNIADAFQILSNPGARYDQLSHEPFADADPEELFTTEIRLHKGFFCEGDHVQLVSLSQEELNGQSGECVRWDNERWDVQLRSGLVNVLPYKMIPASQVPKAPVQPPPDSGVKVMEKNLAENDESSLSPADRPVPQGRPEALSPVPNRPIQPQPTPDEQAPTAKRQHDLDGTGAGDKSPKRRAISSIALDDVAEILLQGAQDSLKVPPALDAVGAWIQGTRAEDHQTIADFRILLLGATGSGKTSFLNLLCNFGRVNSLGVADVNAFAHVNRMEIENPKQKMQSQTSDATVYRTKFGRHVVEIIDTPGMVDTRGPEQDRVHMEKIIGVINGVDSLNLIVVVASGATTILDPALEVALHSIAGMMPAQTLPEVFAMYTHVDSELKLTFDHKQMEMALNAQNLPFGVIDNPFSQLQKAKTLMDRMPNADFGEELKATFVRTRKELQRMAGVLYQAKPTATVEFKKLYDIKVQIETTTSHLILEMDALTEHKKFMMHKKAELDNAMNAKEACSNFSRMSTYQKQVLKSTKDHNTLCMYPNCHSNCHAPCKMPICIDANNKEYFKMCAVMGGGDKCKKCHHGYEHHYHIQSAWELQTEQITSVDEAMKAKFEAAESDEKKLQALKDQAQRKLQECEEQQKNISDILLSTIVKFEKFSNVKNYAGMLRSKIRLLEVWIQAKGGLAEAQDMVKGLQATKKELEAALDVVKRL